MTLVSPDWWDDAACGGRHDLLSLFVPDEDRGGRRFRAPPVPPELAALCATCPVTGQCLAAGWMDGYAIRGGTTAAMRRAERKRRRTLDVRAG